MTTMAAGRVGPVPTRPAAGTRIHHLDWLRVAALFGVFLYHSVHPFDTMDWHVKNAAQSEAITVLVFFLSAFGLGVFFLLAGSGAYFSLRSRSPRGYAIERGKRLLVPLMTAWVLLSPVQRFIEERHEGSWDGSFVAFVRRFFGDAVINWETWPSRPRPLFLGWDYHLWFVEMLLWFALLGLPIALALRTQRGQRLTAWLAEHSSWRGSSLLFGVPITLGFLSLLAASPEEHGWGEFAGYFTYFLVGYVLVSDPRFLAAVRRDLVPALVVGVVGFAAVAAFDPAAWLEQWLADPAYTTSYVLNLGLFLLQGWAWAVVALGVGMRIPRFRTPLPEVIADAAMPFFLLHQPVILAFAFFIVQWNAVIPVKVAVLLLLSLTTTAAAAWLLSHAAGVRTLLGVKPRPRAP